jgi:anti-sigma factor RsiW
MTDNFFDGERSGAVIDERFELLSAYLDGEVTPSERQQVEALLKDDAGFQLQYRQMQQMQQMHHSCSRAIVPSSQSVEALAAGVFGEIDRRRNRKMYWISGGAIAATLVAAVSGLGGLFGNDPQLQFATNKANTPAPLMLALNDPILSMPAKAAETEIELPMSSPEVNAD